MKFLVIWDEGLEYLIDFDRFDEQTIRYKKATGIGLSALDMFRGNIKDIRKGFSIFKNLKKVRSELSLANIWHKRTFDTAEESWIYHLRKHGKKRTAIEYTNDAMIF